MKKSNLLFIIVLLLFGIVLVFQYFIFEDSILSILERLEDFSFKEKFSFTQDIAFFNQFGNRSLGEIYEIQSGKIPILEYHIIESPYVYSNFILTKKIKKNKRNERYFITSDEFRNQLKRLYENNFRNISLDEYLSLMKGKEKNLNRLPPGSKLYVLTFDDATYGQLDFIEDEKGNIVIDPECAVGIMIDFARKHPDFKLNAAFCIDFEDIPFVQKEYVERKLNLLLDLGFEIVNHTKDHKSLSKLFKRDKTLVEYQIGRAMELFELYLGYRVASINKICYPFGDNSKELGDFLNKIVFNGKEYNFVAALDAEGPLAYNPNSKEFNPFSIRRIEVTPFNFEHYVLNARGVYTTPPLRERPQKKASGEVTLVTNITDGLIKLP